MSYCSRNNNELSFTYAPAVSLDDVDLTKYKYNEMKSGWMGGARSTQRSV